MSELAGVLSDLTDEAAALDEIIVHLDESQWAQPTPAPGWTVKHQIAHIIACLHLAAAAATDPDRFTAMTARIGKGFDRAAESALAPFLTEPPPVLLANWRAAVSASTAALAAVPTGEKVAWLIDPWSPETLARAEMTEIFGHGQDVADALGIRRSQHDRILQVATFGAHTRDHGYLVNDLVPPADEFRFELTGPSGDLWAFGPEYAEQRVTGSAVDFCLLVTRRRHRADLDLVAHGAEADRWLDIAQAYCGPAGWGRSPGQFAAPR